MRKNLVVFDFYILRNFSWRLAGLICTGLVLSIIFEHITRPELSWPQVALKLPFLLHKFLPFCLFLASLLTMAQWQNSRQWHAFACTGAHLSRWLRGPLLISLGVVALDIAYISPQGYQGLHQWTGATLGKGKISLHAGGWTLWLCPDGHALVNRQDSLNADYLRFDNQGALVEHIHGQWGSGSPQNHTLDHHPDAPSRPHTQLSTNQLSWPTVQWRQAWRITSGQPAQFYDTYTMPLQGCPVPHNEHPLFMSWQDLDAITWHEQRPMPSLTLRAHYIFGHAVWMLTLVPLAVALMLNAHHWWRQAKRSLLGITWCIVTYLLKEWSYALSLPLSFFWQPWLLWGVVGINLACLPMVFIRHHHD